MYGTPPRLQRFRPLAQKTTLPMPSIRVWLTKEAAAELLDVAQINPVLRSIVLITESIFPLNTCLARLRVKPVTAWKGRCAGSNSA
jgi:hypothetical protein